MCGVAYSVTWDRHSLDNGSRACAACCELTFSLHGVTEYGSAVCLLDGTLMSAGKRTEWCTDHATIRRWAADAAAHGVSKITLRISRHTRRLGTHERRWIKFGAAS